MLSEHKVLPVPQAGRTGISMRSSQTKGQDTRPGREMVPAKPTHYFLSSPACLPFAPDLLQFQEGERGESSKGSREAPKQEDWLLLKQQLKFLPDSRGLVLLGALGSN